MKIQTLTFALALALPSLVSANPVDKPAATEKPAKLADADIGILAHVHHVNQMEIELGTVAQRAGTAPVKRYGETLVRDHTTADKELLALAKKHGLAKIPADATRTDADREQMKQMMADAAAMKKLKGVDFDRAYLKMMVEGHDGELARTDPAIAIAGDADVKAMLETRKATLTRHADTARELQKGNAQASSN